MSKYLELKTKYTQERQEFLVYWDDLAELADRTLKDFAKYLGVDPASSVQVDGEKVKALRIGRGGVREFVPCASNELERDGEELRVVFELTFELETDPPAIQRDYFHLKLSGKHGQFQGLIFEGFRDKAFHIPGEVGFFETLMQSAT